MKKEIALIFTLSVFLPVLNSAAQTNLLVNGAFELGNIGFSSDYTNSPGNIIPAGTYDVVSNPYNSHPDATSFGDHTTGSGLMLAVNGGSDPQQIVWSETITVATNTTYFLSGWGASWGGGNGVGVGSDPSSAQLVFSVNGTQIGNAVTIPAQNAVWQSFTAVWNSQTSTQAVIQIRDLNSVGLGNDFALDDLIFSPLSTNLISPAAIYNSVEINWASTPAANYQVQWTASLLSSNWFNLGSPINAKSTNTSVWDRTAPGARFYRVLVFQ